MNTNTLDAGASSLEQDPQAAALWEKLCRFSFDRGAGPRTFAARLASEQGWSASFTAFAIGEYRRYLLLFALSCQRHPHVPAEPAVRIVPSGVVDKVWHLHLLYTESYWGDLCREILGVPLHHRPADGSAGEGASLDVAYRETLETYRQTFGQTAPESIWPGVEAGERVPSAAVSKIAWARWTPVGLLAGATLLLIFGWQGWVFAAVCVFVGVVIRVADISRRRAPRRAKIFGGSPGQDGWAYAGMTSGDAGAYTHHGCTSHGGGAHDAGGHTHSCGGHSCGGHGCGGHGCGGH